jgi:hypothetical protein
VHLTRKKIKKWLLFWARLHPIFTLNQFQEIFLFSDCNLPSSQHMKTKLSCSIFLLMLSTFFGTACERLDDPGVGQTDKGMQARPIEGWHVPPGPCDCGIDCNVFGVSASLEPTAAYDFALKIERTSDCDEIYLDAGCSFTDTRMDLAFVFDPLDPDRFDLSDIEEIDAEPLGQLIPDPSMPSNITYKNQVYENLQGTKLAVYGPSILYFRWKQGRAHPVPKLENIVTGGICIIGILTDPCFPCFPNFGRPFRPVIPRPYRPFRP